MINSDVTEGTRLSNEAGTIPLKKKMGFAAMDPERRRALASKGGKKVSLNKAHMAKIGSKGGVEVQKRNKLKKINESSNIHP
jgi:general stress protein YciG